MVRAVSVEKFYGTRHAAKAKTGVELINQPMTVHKPEPKFLRGLLGPSLTWKVFRKQADALQFAKAGKSLMSFAFEMPSGERAFLVCHPLRLWYQHDMWKSDQKCTYEIIPEASKCKLYLDVEFEYQFNPGSCFEDGESKLRILIHLVTEMIRTVLGYYCSLDDVLDLDSSTSNKFSRHLIVNLKDAAFDNNKSIGNFVTDLLHNVNEKVGQNEPLFDVSAEDLRKLTVLDRKGQEKFIVDTAVYTRNRHFRLLGSTKLNKNAPLAVSLINRHVPAWQEPCAWLLSSLVTYFDQAPNTILSYGQQLDGKKFHQLSSVPCPLEFQVSSNSDDTPLSNFISTLIAPHGRIRQKSISQLGDVVKYDISRNRFCGNIQREHRSNNIAFLVNLMSLTYQQMCYDPECKGYRSPATLLPPEVIFDCNGDQFMLEMSNCNYSLDDTDDGISDQELVGAVDDAETALAIFDDCR